MLPGVKLKIKDGALGLVSNSSEGLHVKIGVAAAGPVNELIIVTDLDQIKDTYLSGLLPEAAAASIQVSGEPVLMMRIVPAALGVISAVTPVGAGTSTLSVTGSPVDTLSIKVRTTRAAASLAAATAAIQFSLDNGKTYSSEKAVPVSGIYVIADAGITLTFSAGTFLVDAVHSFDVTAPLATVAEWMAATDLVLADARTYEWIHYVTSAADATLAAAVEAKLVSAENDYQYLFGILDDTPSTVGQTDAQYTAARIVAYAAFEGIHTGIFSGDALDVSALTGRVAKRPGSWRLNGRLAAVSVEEDLGRVASGPIAGIVSLYHDERASPGLYAAGITTLRTFKRRGGYFCAGGVLKTASTSDFRRLANRRVMNKAARISYDRLLELVKDDVRVDADTGFILETEARQIETELESVLRTGLLTPGNASDIQVRVKRNNNILQDGVLYVKIRIVPVAYLDFIEAEIAFRNPALDVPAVVQPNVAAA